MNSKLIKAKAQKQTKKEELFRIRNDRRYAEELRRKAKKISFQKAQTEWEKLFPIK